MKIYSKIEYKYMLQFQAIKDKFLTPIVKTLVRFKISANFVSVVSGLTAFVSILLAIKFKEPVIFVIGIWFHFFLDGLDGSVARATNKKMDASGLLMDLVFDSIGIWTMGFYVLYFDYVTIISALFFITLYSLINIISYIFAKTDKEFDFIIRPRIFVLISIGFDYILFCSTIPVIILISNILLAFFLLVGIKKLIKK